MKNIKSFKIFLEKLSQEDLNILLDKIGSKGYNSLTDLEKNKLDDHSKGIVRPYVEDIISDINKMLAENYNGAVSISELMSDSSPIYKEGNQEIHLIEFFMEDLATVEVYNGYEYESHLNSYDITYDEISIEILSEIRDLIKFSLH